MRKSKYLNKEFDNGWVITHVGVARVQPKFYIGTRIVRARPGHQSYYYIAERMTSDGKADKMIRLSDSEIVKVSRGFLTIEEIADKRTVNNVSDFTKEVSYHFYEHK